MSLLRTLLPRFIKNVILSSIRGLASTCVTSFCLFPTSYAMYFFSSILVMFLFVYKLCIIFYNDNITANFIAPYYGVKRFHSLSSEFHSILVKWHSWFWMAMKHCCHGNSQWMTNCQWWKVLWNAPPPPRRVKIHYSTNGISSGSLDIHSKRSDHRRQYPWSENK